MSAGGGSTPATVPDLFAFFLSVSSSQIIGERSNCRYPRWAFRNRSSRRRQWSRKASNPWLPWHVHVSQKAVTAIREEKCYVERLFTSLGGAGYHAIGWAKDGANGGMVVVATRQISAILCLRMAAVDVIREIASCATRDLDRVKCMAAGVKNWEMAKEIGGNMRDGWVVDGKFTSCRCLWGMDGGLEALGLDLLERFVAGIVVVVKVDGEEMMAGGDRIKI
ncbi:hypothetical protein B0T20DRAFT_389544 [Sordaria brevicollis]|uniref:Uncharacterized protein n=1 Tax=Sordaria brevicollis TaxID=83679 RepID=A0AAE0UET3_SORBR|nr:hypothetical protein B0T20DRAFT_389544 [Sordaria brevicollis]